MRYIRRIPHLAAPLLALAGLCSCALSPQTVRFDPALQGSPPAGRDVSVALRVTDVRKDPIIGYRGGVYATASITADPGLEDGVRAALVRALEQGGWQIVEAGRPARLVLDVEIAELRYAVTQQKVTRIIETAAAVRARASSGEVTRTGDYRDRRTKEVLKAPSESENAALLNDVLAAALQRLVADPDLLRF